MAPEHPARRAFGVSDKAVISSGGAARAERRIQTVSSAMREWSRRLRLGVALIVLSCFLFRCYAVVS